MKKLSALLLALALLFPAAGCAAPSPAPDTVSFTDSCGRTVELPGKITRIAPSGGVAAMLLAIIAPDLLVTTAETPDPARSAYLPDEVAALPATGQLYGGKSTMNLEALLSAAPQVVIDLGEAKSDIAESLDALTEQTGIPSIFIDAGLGSMADAFRTLGTLLGRPERGEELAAFVEETLTMAEANRAEITEPVSVMYTGGAGGLNTNAAGSFHAQVLDIVGAENAVVLPDVSGKNGGNPINMEQLYIFDPDVIVFSPEAPYREIASSPEWGELTAIRNGTFYLIPDRPYNWMGTPPSVNTLLGVWWLGALVYPDVYDYDMTEAAQRIFRLLWGYELTDAEARELLAESTEKAAAQ